MDEQSLVLTKVPWGWDECEYDELHDEFHLPKTVADITEYDPPESLTLG